VPHARRREGGTKAGHSCKSASAGSGLGVDSATSFQIRANAPIASRSALVNTGSTKSCRNRFMLPAVVSDEHVLLIQNSKVHSDDNALLRFAC